MRPTIIEKNCEIDKNRKLSKHPTIKKASFRFSQKKNIGYALGQEIVDPSSFEKN